MERRTTGLLITLVLFTSLPLNAGKLAPIIYVDADAPGANDGSSWFNAFNSLQDALAAAQPGCTVRVAEGVYTPNRASHADLPGGRVNTFQLKQGVAVLGGYAGYATPKPWLRDTARFETVLSGDLLGNDPPVMPDTADEHLLDAPFFQDNAFSVVTASGVDATAVLDGFTLTGGNANLVEDVFPYAHSRGGALFAFGGDPTIRRCVFRANAALSGGGAVYNYMTEAGYTHCAFAANYSASEGGAMANASADPNVAHCDFRRNHVFKQGEGGAVHNYDSNPQIHDCNFVGNEGGAHGGALYNGYSDAVVTACRFLGNTAARRGAGVYNATGSRPEFADCVFRNNHAGEWGGGMMNYYCAPTLASCVFQGNAAQLGAGIYNRYSDPNVINAVFVGNIAGAQGGAIGCLDTDLRVTNSTFWANQAPQGLSLACASNTGPSSRSRVQISNSILWNPGQEVFLGDGSEVLIRFSDVHGAWPGAGNIADNPLFLDPLGPDHRPGTADDNLRLSVGSPCIDAGDNTAVPTAVTEDLAGRARFLEDPLSPNTGRGRPPVVDMGAYEFRRGSGGGGAGNRPPSADAGPPQTVYARINGQATVNLDGSGSYDPDGDALTYLWRWTVEGTPEQATGRSAQVQMPVGDHAVQLTVADGHFTSPPALTIVSVQDFLRGEAWMWPYDLSRSSSDQYLNVYVVLPGVKQAEVDLDRSLILYPGTIKAVYLHASETVDGLPTTTLFAMFNRAEVLAAVSANGERTFDVAGRLLSGQYFAGEDTLNVVP